MSDEKLRHAAFPAEGERLDACADTERAPGPPASVPVRGAALSVLWWEAEEAEEAARKN